MKENGGMPRSVCWLVFVRRNAPDSLITIPGRLTRKITLLRIPTKDARVFPKTHDKNSSFFFLLKLNEFHSNQTLNNCQFILRIIFNMNTIQLKKKVTMSINIFRNIPTIEGASNFRTMLASRTDVFMEPPTLAEQHRLKYKRFPKK